MTSQPRRNSRLGSSKAMTSKRESVGLVRDEATFLRAKTFNSRNSRLETMGWTLIFVLTYLFARSNAGEGVAFGSCTVLGLSYFLVSKSCKLFAIDRITIASFWYLTYLAMIFFPAFYIFRDQPGPYRSTFLIAVESVLITVPLGWYWATSGSAFLQAETDSYFRRQVEDVRATPQLYRGLVALLAISILLTILYLLEVRTIPLLYLFGNFGDFWELMLLREESFKLLNSPLSYFYAVNRDVLFPFLITASLIAFLRTRHRQWLILLLLTLGFGIFYASLTLAKAPVATIFLMMMIAGYLFSGGYLSRTLVAAGLILIFAFPIFVVVSVARPEDHVGVEGAFAAVAERLFYLPAEVVYFYFEVFPGQMHYLHGSSIDKLTWLTGQPYFNTANYVGRYAYPEYYETVNANGAFVANLNADFGLPGVFLGGVLAGYIMQKMHIFLVRARKTIPNVASYGFLIFAFWTLHSSPLPIVLASGGALLVLIFKWFIERPLQRRRPPMNSAAAKQP